MTRLLLCLGLSFAVTNQISAQESFPAPQPAQGTTATSSAAPNDTKPARTISRRKNWEALLLAPSRLDFGKRETVTVQEVLDQIHRQHQISFRFDVPTLKSMLGDAAPGLATASGAAPLVSAAPTFSAPPPAGSEDRAAEGAQTTNVESAVETKEVDRPLAVLATVEVNLHDFDIQSASIATVLRHVLDAVPVGELVDVGLPITLTNASLIDYLLEDDGLLITSRMNALTVKETRVYSIKHLKEFTPDQLAKVIHQSVRPWSWRSHLNDLGNQLKERLPADSSDGSASFVAQAVRLVAEMAEVDPAIIYAGKNRPGVSADEGADNGSDAPPGGTVTTNIDAKEMANALIMLAQASISALEMIHFSDLPTGTIETLPGKLVITQSQAAHREIADLLWQLAE